MESTKLIFGRLTVSQLHPPRRTRGEHNQDLTIIFFCGSTNERSGWRNTWIQRGDPEVCWPRDWLPKAVEKWGLTRGMLVLSVSYLPDTCYFSDTVQNVADKLVEILLDSARWHLTHPQTIVLVGYGIGGLVIKYFLAQVDKVTRGTMLLSSTQGNCKAFQENLQGIVFYAVPHSGSSEDFAKYLKICKNLKTSGSFLTLSVESFHEFKQRMEELDFDFRYSIKEETMIMAIVEGRPMGQQVLVPDTSAQMLAGNFFYKIEDANYLEVCQPVDEQRPSYVKFLSGLEAMMRPGMMTPANVEIATPVTPSVSVTSDCVAFPYQVLCDATNNFDPISQIGTGASGTVFKARIPHNGSECEVAIKRLSYDGFSSELNELNEAFRQEIWRVSTVRHKNIVSVLGYSVQDNSPLLMVTPLHCSLFKCLYEGENPWLNWQARLKIAVGVAEGLAYLHDGAPERLVHCDIKPGNILFDADTLQAYIADFGTAKFMQRSESMVETLTVRGTRGFMDPHFLQYRCRSTKMDVYSFGVLLLVLVSGEEDARKLVQKAKKEIFVDIQFILRHDGTYKAWEVSRVVEIAKQCMRYEPSDRPSMSQVVMMLRGDIPCSIRSSLSSFVVSSLDFVQTASTSTFHKLRHSSILGAAVLIAAILMIVVMWKTSV